MTDQLSLFEVRTTPWGQASVTIPVRESPAPAETVPRGQRIHWNSREGLARQKHPMAERARRILLWFRDNASRTDRDCRDAMFGAHADMNTVRPRITELIDDALLEEIGRVPDSLTGHSVRLVRATRRGMEVET